MAAQDTSNYSSALKEFYAKAMLSLLNRKVVLYSILKKNKEGWNGKYFKFATHIQAGYSAGARREGGTLPEHVEEGFVNGTIYNRSNYVTVEVTGQAVAQSKNEDGAWAQVQPELLSQKAKNFADVMNRQYWAGGVGVLAEVKSVSSLGAGLYKVTVKNYYQGDTITNKAGFAWDTAKCLKVNMRVAWGMAKTGVATDFESATGSAAGYGRVTAKNTDGSYADFTVLMLDGVAPIADNIFIQGDALVRASTAYDAEITGIRFIVDNADDDLEGVDTTTYREEWQANVLRNPAGAGQLRNLRESDMQRVFDYVNDYSTGECDLIICHTSVRSAFIDVMKAKGGERYAPTKFSAGTSVLTFNGGGGDTQIKSDKDAPHYQMYFLSTEDIENFEVMPPGWDETGQVGSWSKKRGMDAYEAFLKAYSNLGTRNRRAHGRLDDIMATGIAA